MGPLHPSCRPSTMLRGGRGTRSACRWFSACLLAAIVLLPRPLLGATYLPTTTAELVADINTANGTAADDVIDLGGQVFILSAAAEIGNGLPTVQSAATGGRLSIINGTIERAAAAVPFRFLNLAAGADLTLDNVTLANGLVSTGSGGAIFNAGTLAISAATFSGNFANSGGAVYNSASGAILAIQNSTFEGNTANSTDGGAVANDGSISTIARSTFSANVASHLGGAIVDNGTIATIANSTFSGNIAGNGGGAIVDNGTITTIANSTFSGNHSNSGGGINVGTSATLSTLASTIVALNTGSPDPDVAVIGTLTSASSNLIGDGSGSGIVNGVNGNIVGTSGSPLNPMLGALANNGGPTQTMLPLPGSPAIDTGANPLALVFDQRGTPYVRTFNQTDIGAVEVQPLADLAVAKSGPATITAGTNITYSVTVTNNGPDDAQNVTLSDPLPAGTTFVSETQSGGPAFTCTKPAAGGTGTVSCTLGTLAAGASANFSLVDSVGAGVAGGTVLTNVATVSSSTGDPAAGNNSAPTTASVAASADLAVTKSGPATIDAGNNISYSITVTNNGPSDAQGVTLSDATPVNTTFVSETQNSGPAFACTAPPIGGTGTVSCTLGTLAAGASASFTMVDQVGVSAPGGTTITNTAGVTSTTPDAVAGNNSATATTTIFGTVDLSVTKTASPPPYGTGLPVTYTIGVHNAGPSPAMSVVVTDPLPAGTTFVSATPSQGSCSGTATVICTLGTIASGGSASISLTLTLPATPGTVSNTASVSSSNPDTNAANDMGTAAVTVIPVAEIPALSPLLLLLLAAAMGMIGLLGARG